MTEIMGRRGLRNVLKLAIFELFSLVSNLRSAAGRRALLPGLTGRARAFKRILRG
jgi:hypothetical protein